MRLSRFALAAAVVLAACSDSSVPPATDGLAELPVAGQLVDGNNNGGDPNFFFLPPLVKGSTPTGTFNGQLAPYVSICQLNVETDLTGFKNARQLAAALQGAECTVDANGDLLVVRTFDIDEMSVSDGAYQASWDTDGPETQPALTDGRFYRVRVFLNEFADPADARLLGSMDTYAADPSGNSPSNDASDLYAFRLGETLPLKFWISQGVVCESGGIVVDCTEVAWYNSRGVTAYLDPKNPDENRIGFSCVVECRGTDVPQDVVTLILERIDPSVECIVDPSTERGTLGQRPGIDTPTFGDCLRLRTEPDIYGLDGGDNPLGGIPAGLLDIPGVVGICADLDNLTGIVDHAQSENLQIVRQPDDGSEIQYLANVPAPFCPPVQTALFTGDGPVTRALAAVGNLVGPQPVVAGDSLGGGSRRLSYFTWSIPCRLGYPDGDAAAAGSGQFGRVGDPLDDPLSVACLDKNDVGVANVKIRFRGDGTQGTADGGPTVEPDVDGAPSVLTDGAGTASWAWTPGVRGTNTMEAWGNGLLSPGEEFPTHCFESGNDHCEQVVELPEDVQFQIPVGSLAYTATASNPPAGIFTAFDFDSEVVVGSTLGPILITVGDAGTLETSTGVPGQDVTWSISGGGCLTDGSTQSCSIDDGAGGFTTATFTTTTDVDGKTSISWTLGTTAGTQTLTVSAGTVTESYVVTALPGAPASIEAVAGSDGQTADVGTAVSLAVAAKDQYGNLVGAQDQAEWTVDWTALTGGGSFTPDPSGIGAGGQASTSWTLGALIGDQSARAQLVGASGNVGAPVLFTATATCAAGSGLGSALIDGAMDAEWTKCARSETFTANVGNGGVPATLYWMNDADNLYLAVAVDAADRKLNSLRFDFHEGFPAGEDGARVASERSANDDAFNFDPVSGIISDDFLSETCSSSNQAGCGDPDETVSGGLNDGEAAFSNGSRTTFYEISKPLTSDAAGKDFDVVAGDRLGFFLTLRIGTGAKGNTQWPQFKEYFVITIKGTPPAPTQ